MSIDLYTEFFMQQEVADTADDEYKTQGVLPNNFLKDVVLISPSIEIISEWKNISHKVSPSLEALQDSSFIVNYNELVSRLGELGYESNYQCYEQLLGGELVQKPANFTIDFSLEKRKSK